MLYRDSPTVIYMTEVCDNFIKALFEKELYLDSYGCNQDVTMITIGSVKDPIANVL